LPFSPAPPNFSASSSLNSMASLLGSLLLSFLFLSAYAPFRRSYPRLSRAQVRIYPAPACHEAWPKLNAFGQTFKRQWLSIDERQGRSHLAAARLLAGCHAYYGQNWHRNSVDRDAIDDPNIPGNTIEQKVTTHGIRFVGLGHSYPAVPWQKIFLSLLVPSIDGSGSGVGFESAFVRF